MKKIVIAFSTLLVLMTLTGCGCSKKEKKENQNNENLTEIESQVQNGTAEEQGDYKVTNIKIKEVGAQSVVSGKIVNNTNEVRSVKLTLIMSNSESGVMYGIIDGDILALEPKEERDFSLSIVGDYSNVDNFEVRTSEINTESNNVDAGENIPETDVIGDGQV